MVEFNREILKVGQRWERADGKVVTVSELDSHSALLAVQGTNGIWYRYKDGGKSNIHRDHPHLELLRLLLDEEEVTEALTDKPEDDVAPVEDDAAPIEDDAATVEQESEAFEQEVTVASSLNSIIHNYPELGSAVVRIKGLQIEVDFDERCLSIKDNLNAHPDVPFPDL